MGDKGGKKDKDKIQKQTTKKHDKQNKEAEEKQPKKKAQCFVEIVAPARPDI